MLRCTRNLNWAFRLIVFAQLTHLAITVEIATQYKNYEQWATKLEASLSGLREFIGVDALNSAYNSAEFDRKEITEEVSFAMLDQALQKIREVVTMKSKLVHQIKTVAENAYMTKSDEDPQQCYYRAKAISLNPPVFAENATQNCSEKRYLDLQRNALFMNRYVSTNNSVAHVPTNVYDLSPTLTNVGNWTQALNEVFQNNAHIDRTLKWQYFCSSTGFFRYYPGAMWDIQLDENRLDFFDCRSQPWYLAASSYAKEMIILVDKSGSMKGRSDIISNATVTEILNTLTENDYFNIIMFSDLPKYVDPDVDDRLLQAIKYNKDNMMKRFKDFAPNGTASFERALIEAFNLLNNTNDVSTTKKCNRMLMMITDSVPASYKDLFDQYNPEKNIRVFVYLLGQHSSAEPYVEEMACYNRGHAVTITTLADVKENVLKYLDVVARSNVLQNHSYITWSGVTAEQLNLRELGVGNFTKPFIPTYSEKMYIPGVYPFQTYQQQTTKIDTLIAAKEDAPPLFTTVAEAVYDITADSISQRKGNLLGVAGIDVPLQSFKDVLRGWEIGVNNYLFAVDNNGFVLFHPKYQPTYKSVLKNYYQNVDLNDVEVPEHLKPSLNTAGSDYESPLRDAVLSGERRVSTLDTLTVVDNRHMVFQTARKYFTTPVEGTPFTLGLAVHWNRQTDHGYPIPEYGGREDSGPLEIAVENMNWFASSYADQSMECKTLSNTSSTGVTLSPYDFCKFDKHLAETYWLDPVCALKQVLTDRNLQTSQECDQLYLRRIVAEARKSIAVAEVWNSKSSVPLIKELGIQQTFSFHHGGLIRYRNFSALAYPNFISDHKAGVEDPLYVSTVLTARFFGNQPLLIFHPIPNDLYRQYSAEDIPVPTSVTSAVLRDPEKVPMAVVGVQLTHEKLQQILTGIWEYCDGDGCEHCGNSSTSCYLMNQAGVVLHSSQGEKDVGRSLKEIDCGLVDILVKESVLVQHDLYDFQSVCIQSHPSVQSMASKFLWPFAYLSKTLTSIVQEVTMFWFVILEQIKAKSIYGQKLNYDTGITPNNVQVEGSNGVELSEQQKSLNSNEDHPERWMFETEFGADGDRINVDVPNLPPLNIDDSEQNLRVTTEQPSPQPTNVTTEDEYTDEYTKQDQDSYELQIKALEDIERCREKESLAIQAYTEQETQTNATEESSQRNQTQVKALVPGNLLGCVHKSVQQRCRPGSGTSSFTERYACEIICGIIRERLPQMAHKLDECRQPLVPCTEKFETFQIHPKIIQTGGPSNTWDGDVSNNVAMKGIELNTACGSRHWWIRRIRETNLFLLIARFEEGQTSDCKHKCRKPYRYGRRVSAETTKARSIKGRREPPIPATCSVVEAEMEDSGTCNNALKNTIPRSYVLFPLVLQCIIHSR